MARGQDNTCKVTFRFERRSPMVLLVRGSRAEVDAQIRSAVGKGHKAMALWDLTSNRNVTVPLEEAETWSVKDA